MSIITRIVLIGLLCFPTGVLAGDTGSTCKVTLVRVPNGGDPVVAKMTGDRLQPGDDVFGVTNSQLTDCGGCHACTQAGPT